MTNRDAKEQLQRISGLVTVKSNELETSQRCVDKVVEIGVIKMMKTGLFRAEVFTSSPASIRYVEEVYFKT